MPVFISHSHQDKDFVDKLAAQLVLHKTYVWLDRWEIKVGDSLLGKVQEGIKSASALLIVLSKASVASEWCKKELNAGLMRELDEKRVVILPLLLEGCDIPVFRGGSGNSDSVVSGSLASPKPPGGGEPEERGDEENTTESQGDV